MASAAASTTTARRIQPPRVYQIQANLPRRRFSATGSLNEIKSPTTPGENEIDHERCLIEENQLREINRRQILRIELLERDYRQLDDDLSQLQIERDVLLKQKRLLEDELSRSSHHASANLDLHVYTQRLESECRDLRCEISIKEKEKFELNEIIVDLEVQLKQTRDKQEECQDTFNELEVILANETENRQCLELKLDEANRRMKENESQIVKLQNELEEAIADKQDILKTNYVLVQNAESLREQLRMARTQAAEVQMIRNSSSFLGDNLDESLPCFVINDNDEDVTGSCSVINDSVHCQSSLFSEINSIETLSDELVSKYLDGTNDDIEVDVLLSKTTTLASIIPLITQLGEVKRNSRDPNHPSERTSTAKSLLKKILDNIQTFDSRFQKLQVLLMASREQQQCHQAELDDFFRLVDKRLVPDIQTSKDSTNQQTQQRLVSIFEAYEEEFKRLRQLVRSHEEKIRSYEQESIEQQSTATRWRMKATVLEKNQRKLVEKLKEMNSERRQLIEVSAHKRTRRRVMPVIQIEAPQPVKPVLTSISNEFSTNETRLKRSRSLPFLKNIEHGRKSRNDSGVVLNDDWSTQCQNVSCSVPRHRIKSHISSQFVRYTSNPGPSAAIVTKKTFREKVTGLLQNLFLVILLLSILFFVIPDKMFCRVLCYES